MASSKPLTAHQPITALFVAASLFYWFLLRLPILGLYFALPANRQDPTWSWKQAVGVRTAKFLFDLGTSVRFAQVWKIERSPKDSNKAFVPAATDDQLQGPLADPIVKPADLMGDWYPAPFSSEDRDVSRNTKVILYMFGGAYVLGDGSPKNYTGTLDKLCPAINAKAFFLSYRLAASAGGQPFPSQLQDLLSGYLYLVHNVGVAPKNIILAGESAGGNAVASFLRYLEERGPEHIPLPGAALLSSPWLDLTPDPFLRTKDARYKTDVAAWRLIVWGQEAFIPANRTASDIYISPAQAPFRSGVPLWIEAGSEEVSLDTITRFAEGMKREGTDTEIYVSPHGTHVPMWGAVLVGFDPTNSIEAFVAFLKKRSLASDEQS